MNVIDNRKFEFPDELFKEDEFNRLVSFSKSLSDSPARTDSTVGASIVDLNLPHSFGKYELIRLLKRDRVGETFLARHEDSPGEFAVKIISLQHIERVGSKKIRQQLHKLRNESMTAKAVSVSNLTTIFEVGNIDGQYFYSTGHVQGKVLAKVVNSNAISNRLAAVVTKEIADSIYQLHSAGVCHGALRPANIVLDSESQPHILPCPTALSGTEEDDSLTFQAPEVSARDNVNITAEVWSIGAILYACLVGEHVERGVAVVPPRKRNPKVARDLEAICMKCLSKEPQHRYANAGALATDLDRFLEYQTIFAKPYGLVGKLIKKLSQMG